MQLKAVVKVNFMQDVYKRVVNAAQLIIEISTYKTKFILRCD